jgi:PII-like signaling protein
MLHKGPAKKVTIHLNETTRAHLEPLWVAVFEYLHHKQVAGVNLIRPTLAFGSHHLIRRADLPEFADPSVRIEFVDTAERVEEVLPTLYELVTDGLIEVQDTTIIKAVRKERAPQARLPHQKVQEAAKMMRIFLGESDKWNGEPLYDAIVKRLRMLDIAGATVYRGILGYGAKGETHKEGFFHLSGDLPIMISVVDGKEQIEEAAEAIQSMLGDALIVLSEVDIVRLVHKVDMGGAPHAGPPAG